MNYKKLLKKFIEHAVESSEKSSFTAGKRPEYFSPKEWNELQNISNSGAQSPSECDRADA
jgi:hypothetical protein